LAYRAVVLIIGIIVTGMVVGALAQLALGRAGTRIDWTMALVAGLAGSFVGGLLFSLIAGDGLSLRASGLIGSFIGAVLVTVVWTRLDSQKKNEAKLDHRRWSGDFMNGSSRVAWRIAGISFLQATGLVTAYYLMPINFSERSPALRVVSTIVILVLVLAWQVRAVMRAESRLYRGLISLGLVVPLLIVVYASIYLTLSISNAASFSEELGRTDALYFTMTTLATVGYGDIFPTTPAARITAMSQMVANVIVIGLAVRVVGHMASDYFSQQPSDGS